MLSEKKKLVSSTRPPAVGSTRRPCGAPGGYHMLAQDGTPHLCEHDAADPGKVAYYILRWVNTHAEKGPWSAAASATIS